MTIRLDESKASGVVVTCDDCPYWFAFRFTRDTAEDAAIVHEENVHEASHDVRDRAATRARVAAYGARKRARHAGDSSD